MAIQWIIQIIHALIRKTIRHPEVYKISAHANTVSVQFYSWSDLSYIVVTRRRFNNVLSENSNKFTTFFCISFPGAPVYISNPHFYLADPELLDAVVGLKPNQSIHESYFKIQPVSPIWLEFFFAGRMNESREMNEFPYYSLFLRCFIETGRSTRRQSTSTIEFESRSIDLYKFTAEFPQFHVSHHLGWRGMILNAIFMP